MNLLLKIPGYILVFLGAVTLSFGGLIVKSLTWIIDGFKKERPPSSQP